MSLFEVDLCIWCVGTNNNQQVRGAYFARMASLLSQGRVPMRDIKREKETPTS